MAFAMKLAAKKAELSLCPYASEEAIRVIGAASEPPVKCIELGEQKELKLGEETVLYSHEKTFVHPPAIAINLLDTDSPEQINAVLNSIQQFKLERAGQMAQIDMIAVSQLNNEDESFLAIVQMAWDLLHRPLVLHTSNLETLTKAAQMVKGTHSVLASATPESIDQFKQIALDNDLALAVTSSDIDEIVTMAENLKRDQFDNILLDFQANSLPETFLINTVARRAALKDNFKPLGYPSLHFSDSHNLIDDTMLAATEVSKYGRDYCVTFLRSCTIDHIDDFTFEYFHRSSETYSSGTQNLSYW